MTRRTREELNALALRITDLENETRWLREILLPSPTVMIPLADDPATRVKQPLEDVVRYLADEAGVVWHEATLGERRKR